MKAVNKTAAKILSLSGRPTRVSKEAVIRKVGHRSWIEQRIDKLPLTAKALEKCIESNEDFLIRRVKWAEGYFCKNGITPTRHQFSVKAGTRTTSGSTPRVQEAITVSLERLRQRVSLIA